MENSTVISVPAWVPEGAQRYLAHTEAGRSIRDLARSAGCHASTILRQIRKIEMRRDDPLVDAALQSLAEEHFPPLKTFSQDIKVRPNASLQLKSTASDEGSKTDRFNLEAVRVLRRLCESGAVLAVAEDMDKAVVVRDGGAGEATRTAVVECKIAQGLALQDWISCDNPGRISRYQITAAGRNALGRLLANEENRARVRNDCGFAEMPAQFSGKRASVDEKCDDGLNQDGPRRVRYSAVESPLVALARRRDREGKPFLNDTLVRAGERLREDFELAQMGPSVTQNWERFLTAGCSGDFTAGDTGPGGSSRARDRVAHALADLGPGLSDVALRCCCYLEGLELAEKRMGWSARSGKIVLRIALQRLKRHYDRQADSDQLIG